MTTFTSKTISYLSRHARRRASSPQPQPPSVYIEWRAQPPTAVGRGRAAVEPTLMSAVPPATTATILLTAAQGKDAAIPSLENGSLRKIIAPTASIVTLSCVSGLHTFP
jgi:hypothetical protein